MKILPSISFLLIFTVPVLAQVVQPKATFSNGGGVSTGTSNIHYSSIGQPFVGASSGTSAINVAGFLGNSPSGALASASISSSDFPDTYTIGSGGTQVSITLDDATLVSSVNFLFKGLSSPNTNFSVQAALTPNGNTYSGTLADGDFSEDIAVVYEFEIRNRNGVTVRSSSGVTYASISEDSQQQLPGLSFGSSVSNYQIVSVPFNLNNKTVLNVFDELAPYDNTRWRLFHYENGSTNEFNTFNSIDVGKGYWLIVANRTTITLGAGSVPRLTDSTPLEIILQPGWNQIGNPFTFTIDWADVLTVNGNPGGIGNLIQFSNGSLTQNNTLTAYRGGFVQNTSDAPVTIQIPANKSTIGGRLGGRLATESKIIDEENWQVDLKLTSGTMGNNIGGVGMNKNAFDGIDSYDISHFPAPFELPELNFTGSLVRDIVKPNESHVWEFSIGGVTDGIYELSWDNTVMPEGNMILIDLHNNRLVDMKIVSSLRLGVGSSRDFKIIYGDDDFVENAAVPNTVSVGDPYPNPFENQIVIPLALDDSSTKSSISFVIFDLKGRQTRRMLVENENPGYHLYTIPTDGLESGVYHLIVEVDNQSGVRKFDRKIIKK